MFSAARAAPLTRSGPRPLPISVSVLVHVIALSLVHFGPHRAVSRQPRSLYDAVIRPHEHELVWYSFARKLPDVSPRERVAAKPAATELLSNQTIISNPKLADRGAQMIWRPAPQIKPQREVTAPNILALQRPLLPPPPPGPPPKLFVPPRPVPKPQTTPVELLSPPAVQAQAGVKLNSVLMAGLSPPLEIRPKPRDFIPPVPRPEKPAAPVALPEAPSVATSARSARVPLLAESMAAPLAPKPQPRQFIPPPSPGRPAASPVVLPDAPKLAGSSSPAAASNAALSNPAATALANRPEPRKFVPPGAASGRPGGQGNAAPAIEEAPSLDLAGMPSASVNVAIVGLTPASKLSGPLPEYSRDARFSAGPPADGTAGGAGSASGTTLSVPNLLVRGGPSRPATDPLMLARVAPTSREMLETVLKSGGSLHAEPPTGSTDIHLAPPPDPAFIGRDVYTLAVQMPNISSYVGSWIMWFADRVPRGEHRLQPPVPLHKVDPKYLPAAMAERIEGKVQIAGVIRANGHVDLLHILKGVDPRLDASAEEALLKWEFAPAQRNGVPVEVDVVAEIPFLLAPQVKR